MLLPRPKALRGKVKEGNKSIPPLRNWWHIAAWETWKYIGNEIFLAMLMEDGGTIFFDKQLWQQFRLSNVKFLWSVYIKCFAPRSIKQNSKEHDKQEEFFIPDMIILLACSQFTIPLYNMVVLLDDYNTYVVVESTGVNVEWYVVVGVCHEDIWSQDCFHDFKGVIYYFWSAIKVFLTIIVRKWLQQMYPFRPVWWNKQL